MPKQHFEALAKALLDAKPERNKHHEPLADVCMLAQWEECVNAVASVCQQFNPRFDRDKFREACAGI
jgi:hypothetical protein